MTDKELAKAAAASRVLAYSPYSEFSVGAALLGSSGQVYSGVNIENASYGLTICAERVAVGVAVAAGERDFQAIAISLKGGGSPCGACRQVLNEFAPDLRVIMADEEGTVCRVMTLRELLPDAFGPHSL